MKHAYDPNCECKRCVKEGRRREAQSTPNRMLNDTGKRGRRGRVAREYWDNFESGRPLDSEDR
jgi:hypothetical protein